MRRTVRQEAACLEQLRQRAAAAIAIAPVPDVAESDRAHCRCRVLVPLRSYLGRRLCLRCGRLEHLADAGDVSRVLLEPSHEGARAPLEIATATPPKSDFTHSPGSSGVAA